jgi:outer membrane protein TolC
VFSRRRDAVLKVALRPSAPLQHAEVVAGRTSAGTRDGDAETHLDVQDAQLNLLAAKTNLTRAQRDYHVARVTLDWVMGILEP